jgi:hypothetical protein
MVTLGGRAPGVLQVKSLHHHRRRQHTSIQRSRQGLGKPPDSDLGGAKPSTKTHIDGRNMYVAYVANCEAAWQAVEQFPHSHNFHEWLGRCMSKSEIRNLSPPSRIVVDSVRNTDLVLYISPFFFNKASISNDV